MALPLRDIPTTKSQFAVVGTSAYHNFSGLRVIKEAVAGADQ